METMFEESLMTNQQDEINSANLRELNFNSPSSQISDDKLTAAVEALIFMSERPISIKKLRDHLSKEMECEYSITTISKCLFKLQSYYELPHHGIRLFEVAEGFQFRTKSDYSKYIKSMYKVSSIALTPSALEVLTIIAYKQPIARLEIDKIRGVENSHIIRGLLDKKLIKILKRDDDFGRQSLFVTTEYFLEMFNLKDLKDLPPEYEIEQLQLKEEVGQISEIKSFLHGTFHSSFSEVEVKELDQLSLSIKSISVDTDFTKSLKQESTKEKDLEKNNEKNEESSLSNIDQTPISKPRSAFELLEEFVLKQEIIDLNIAANASPHPLKLSLAFKEGWIKLQDLKKTDLKKLDIDLEDRLQNKYCHVEDPDDEISTISTLENLDNTMEDFEGIEVEFEDESENDINSKNDLNYWLKDSEFEDDLDSIQPPKINSDNFTSENPNFEVDEAWENEEVVSEIESFTDFQLKSEAKKEEKKSGKRKRIDPSDIVSPF